MISDLLAIAAPTAHELDESPDEIDVDAFVDAVVEEADREVSESEYNEFYSVIEGGWLET